MNYSLFLFNMAVDYKEPTAFKFEVKYDDILSISYSLRQNQVLHTIHDVLWPLSLNSTLGHV